MYKNPFFNLTHCPLCLTDEFPCLENSHLFPRFLKKLHNRSTTRFAQSVDGKYTEQDLPKLPLLCQKCDNERLGTLLERPLSAALRKHGYALNKICKDPAVSRALASVLWRNAFVHRNFIRTPENIRKFGTDVHDVLESLPTAAEKAYYLYHFETALEQWRQYILNGTPTVDYPIVAVHDEHFDKFMKTLPDEVHPKTGQILTRYDNMLIFAGMRNVAPGVYLFYTTIQRLALVGVVSCNALKLSDVRKGAYRFILELHREAFNLGKDRQ